MGFLSSDSCDDCGTGTVRTIQPCYGTNKQSYVHSSSTYYYNSVVVTTGIPLSEPLEVKKTGFVFARCARGMGFIYLFWTSDSS